MSISLFEQFKDLLDQAVQDTDFIRKNTLFQDAAFLASVRARITALTADVTLQQDYLDVISDSGLLSDVVASRQIVFDPKGFSTTLSAYREAVTGYPRRLWSRPGTITDGVYYLLADGGDGTLGTGVFLLNDKLEVLRRFPHYGADATGDAYHDAGAAITFTISSVEYVAIACTDHDVVQIYLYDAPYTRIATIGVADTPGVPPGNLTSPWGLAVDETNEKLFIGCETGQPPGATASNGFVTAFDISTVAAPTHDATPWYYAGTGSLLDNQVYTPNDVFYDGSVLWISNNNDNTVGGFDTSTIATPVCTKFIEASGNGYTLRGPQQIYSRTLVGGYVRLYVANSSTGTIEEFDGVTFEHLNTYGIRALEDNLNSYTRLSPDTYGALAFPQGVAANTVTIDGVSTNVLVTADVTNVRLQQFNLDAYTTDNYVNFEELTFDVPITIDGWTVIGTVPPDMMTVYYRFAQTETFRELPQEAALPATSRVQFRVAVQLDTRRFVRDWYVDKLRIHGSQA